MNEIVWWSDGPSLPMQQLGWMMLMLGGAMGIAFSITGTRHLARRLQPLLVFRRIAASLNLAPAQQWRLYRIARQQHLLFKALVGNLFRGPAAEYILQGEKPEDHGRPYPHDIEFGWLGRDLLTGDFFYPVWSC